MEERRRDALGTVGSGVRRGAVSTLRKHCPEECRALMTAYAVRRADEHERAYERYAAALVNDNYFCRQRQLKLPPWESSLRGLSLASCDRTGRGFAPSRHGSS